MYYFETTQVISLKSSELIAGFTSIRVKLVVACKNGISVEPLVKATVVPGTLVVHMSLINRLFEDRHG